MHCGNATWDGSLHGVSPVADGSVGLQMQGGTLTGDGVSFYTTMVGYTTVAAAVRYDDAELLQSVQDLGLDLNVPGENDLLPLYRACKVTPGSSPRARNRLRGNCHAGGS